MTAALALTLAPVTASAGAPAPSADAPSADAAPPDAAPPDAAPPEAAPPEVAPPEAEQPDAAEPEAEQPDAAEPNVADPDAIAPIEIVPPPEREPPPEPEPEPEPEPVVAPIEGPEQAPEADAGPTPEERAKIKTTRKAGIGLLATGGAVAAAGFGMTLAFTIIGDKAQDAEEPVLEDIEQNDSMAQVGGLLLASGIVVLAVGGMVFGAANKKKAKARTEAHIRMAPTLGGMVLSGQF